MQTGITELADYLDEVLDPVLELRSRSTWPSVRTAAIVVNTTKKTIEIFCNSEPMPLPDDTRQRLHLALEKRLRRVGAQPS